MYHNFENLKKDKKEQILEACIHEFAERGYEKASTNTIIKEAGISKGILFHYFQNKRSLFIYIVDYCIHIFLDEYKKYPLTETGDIFQRLIELGFIKLKIIHTNPEVSKIVIGTYVNSPEDIRIEIESKYSSLTNEFKAAIFEKIDYTKFRRGVKVTKAIEILMLFVEALGNRYLKDYKGKDQEMLQDLDKLMDEYYEYMEILKYGMYAL